MEEFILQLFDSVVLVSREFGNLMLLDFVKMQEKGESLCHCSRQKREGMGEGGHKIESRLSRCCLVLQKSLVHFTTVTLACGESRVSAGPLQPQSCCEEIMSSVIVCHGYLRKKLWL